MNASSPCRVSVNPHRAATYLNLLLFSAGLCMSPPGFAQGFDSDCHALKLKAASGVPAAKLHAYKFVGTCNIVFVHSSGPSVLKTVPAVAAASWDGSKLQLSETFRVLATVSYPGAEEGNQSWNGGTITSGKVASVFKCNADPLVTSASCITTSHVNESGFDQFSNPAKHDRPLLKGKTTLAEAQALSEAAASLPPSPAQPPAPAPAKKMLSTPKKQVQMLSKPSAATPGGIAVRPASGFGQVAAARAPIGAQRALPAGLPDIVSAPQLRVAGTYTVAWGQTLSVPSSAARRRHGGICLFAVQHVARNVGSAPSGAFSRRWLDKQNPVPFAAEYPSIAAGGSMPRTDTLPLKPGVNELTLALDNLGQVKEANETNNLYHVTINVTGACGAALSLAPGAPRSAKQ